MSPKLGGRSLNFYGSFDSVNIIKLKVECFISRRKTLLCFESAYPSCVQSIFQLEICIYLFIDAIRKRLDITLRFLSFFFVPFSKELHTPYL